MESNKSNKSDYLIILIVIFATVIALTVFAQENKSKKQAKELFSEWNDKDRVRVNPANYEDNDDKEWVNSNSNKDFITKGYLAKDIKTLKNDWGLKANEVPDLKAEKRRGVINTLAVDGETGKGSCSELVVILKKSPHVNAENLGSMKINQSQEFADTRNSNDAVIRFAIRKIIEKGSEWNYDVYVLKANSNAGTVSGSSAGSGVYMALLSTFYSDCAIPKNLAITGELETEKKEISAKIKPIPKKYQWLTNRCAQCGKYSQLYHFIYDKINGKLEQSLNNATNPDSQWVFCTWNCYDKWWNKNIYNCLECHRQRFGSCSCCDKYHSWIRENKKEKFCSEECLNNHYPKVYEEGKIVAIGGIGGKILAAIERGCDTIVIPKSNSSDYYEEVPLSARMKVKKLHEVENHKGLENLFLSVL